MEVMKNRPKLASFRVTQFQGENSATPSGVDLLLETKQTIEVGLGSSMAAEKRVQAMVKIEFESVVKNKTADQMATTFKGTYEGKFEYLAEVTEESIGEQFAQEAYQYGLVSQVFPLAMTHFRRELQSFGIDARGLGLGI